MGAHVEKIAPLRVLRASTVEQALAETPSGIRLAWLTERLGPWFDIGDVMVVLRRRPDLFVEWEGRWLSRAASLHQDPRRLSWSADPNQTPPWTSFANPAGAAAGWRRRRDDFAELAFDPGKSDLSWTVNDGAFAGLRIHVSHTVLLDRATWLVWVASGDHELAGQLERAGFFLWRTGDPHALTDVTHRIRPGGHAQLVATLAVHTPLEVADTLTWLLLTQFRVMDPRHVTQHHTNVMWSAPDLRAFTLARRRWENRGRGGTLAHCLRCGNALSDENSAALGYGPECAAMLGLGAVRVLARGRDGALCFGAQSVALVRQRMAAAPAWTGPRAQPAG